MTVNNLPEERVKTVGEQVCKYDVVIVGAGFGGLYALHHLRNDCGFSVKAYDVAGGVGGTWYSNRYPGARVDIESVEYSYSFSYELQQEWEWTERYPSQKEVLKYLNHIADRFDLRRDIQLNTRVTSTIFDEETNQWLVETDNGEQVRAKFVIMATGFVSAPNKPNFKGIETFKGKQYHTAKWPHEGVDFTGQRVAVIGTGSSAIQSIPFIANEAAQLTVFQRTPAYIVPLRNCPLSPEYLKSVKANYGKWRRIERTAFGGYVAQNFEPRLPNSKLALEVTLEERLADYENRYNSGGLCYYNTFPDVFTNREANDTLAEFIRAKMGERISNRNIAEKLIPKNYPILMKRLVADNNYLETFNQDNVSLIDVKESPIERITPDGIMVEGKEYEFDTIVFATGFDAVTGAMTRIDIRGRDNQSLQEYWENGPRNYLGFMISGFPNLFMLDGPGSPGAFYQPVLLNEYQAKWVGSCLEFMSVKGITSIEPNIKAENEWVTHSTEVADQTLLPQADSWYMGANIEGKARVSLMYIGGFPNYKRQCDASAVNEYKGFLLSNTTENMIQASK
ncbi:flavin-containing monooxygenase [Alkalihalobacterium alkalinitrilicum]|uniref:flavin-containing monooxygenase n=1 Tax=Alkalihalobacterium alkalinitrilicum TaxID=427920 RepID=UPI001EE3F7DE|nr:NAD(P)/FAD-dependent oxidoreductase [Alkalihalobacterium alkalinitrilicum]